MATATFSFSQTTPAQRRTLVAAALGWMFDAFDVMLFALVISAIVADFGISKATAGKLAALTLLASGDGAGFSGWVADRIGRTRAVMFGIPPYSIGSFAS